LPFKCDIDQSNHVALREEQLADKSLIDTFKLARKNKGKPRNAVVFRHFQMDVFGPIIPVDKLKHNFALIAICSASRYPFAFPLSTVNSKTVCDALLRMFEIIVIASERVITSDNAS